MPDNKVTYISEWKPKPSYNYDGHDHLAPSMGIILSTVLGVILWTLLIFALWAVFS